MIDETSNEVAHHKPANGPITRPVTFFADFSTINEATGNGIESKLDSVDSGYDSFRQRSRSVNSSSVNNASKVFLAKYDKFPNFKLLRSRSRFGLNLQGFFRLGS